MIGIGIIGTGSISAQHIKAYQFFKERCRIRALYDRTYEKAAEKKEEFNLDCSVYTDYRELLEDDSVQMVSICLPPFMHAEIAEACMRAGKHVLVEKPMAPSLEECDRMIQVQRETGCYLGVVSQNRYQKDNLFLKHAVERGKIGRVLFGKVESCWYRGENYYAPKWRGTWELEGGGCVLNHAIHQIDLLNWIAGQPKEVYAAVENVNHSQSEVEDLATAVLRYESGAVITLTTSLVTHGEGQSLTLHGTKASLSAPFTVNSNVEQENGFPMENQKMRAQIEENYKESGEVLYANYLGQIDDILEFLETGKSGGVSAFDGRNAVEVATAVYASAAEGKTVSLPITQTSEFYYRESRLKRLKSEEKQDERKKRQMLD